VSLPAVVVLALPIDNTTQNVRVAHGVIMAIVFLFLKPAGAILLRTIRGPISLRMHLWWQMFAWLLAFGGVGTGIWLAFVLRRVSDYNYFAWRITTGHDQMILKGMVLIQKECRTNM
jgi:hypothetical protein